MPLNESEIDEWAEAYIKAQTDPALLTDEDHPLWWAVERFMNIDHDEFVNPLDCWQAILRILEKDPSEHVICILAAGPLEDLIEHCGQLFINEIEIQARRDPKFKHLLGGVWKSSTPEIWQRIENIRASV
jgi:hypothetical protein